MHSLKSLRSTPLGWKGKDSNPLSYTPELGFRYKIETQT